MGLFSKLRAEPELELTPQSALLLAAISMVAIDGDVDDDEIAIIRRLDGSGETQDWNTALRAWNTKSIEECIQLVAEALTVGQQAATIVNLIDIAMADGILAGEEKQLLEAYQKSFSVPESEIVKYVDVVSIKNDKSIFN